MVIEGSESPPDGNSHSEEVELSQATIFEEKAQVEPTVPTEAIVEKEKETDRLDSQELDEQLEYLNSLCGKEIQ